MYKANIFYTLLHLNFYNKKNIQDYSKKQKARNDMIYGSYLRYTLIVYSMRSCYPSGSSAQCEFPNFISHFPFNKLKKRWMNERFDIDSAQEMFRNTRANLSKLEDELSGLSAIFPVDINLRISQLRSDISRLSTKTKSLLDDTPRVPKYPKFTDLSYFDACAKNLEKEFQPIFANISTYQNACFDNFVAKNPGPYYKKSSKPDSKLIDHLNNIKNESTDFFDDFTEKYSTLSRKITYSSTSSSEKIQPGPTENVILSQQEQLRQIKSEIIQLQVDVDIEKTKRSSIFIESSIDKKKRKKGSDAERAYAKSSAMIDTQSGRFLSAQGRIDSQLNELESLIEGIEMKCERHEELFEGVGRQLQKAEDAEDRLESALEQMDLSVEDITSAQESDRENSEDERELRMKLSGMEKQLEEAMIDLRRCSNSLGEALDEISLPH